MENRTRNRGSEMPARCGPAFCAVGMAVLAALPVSAAHADRFDEGLQAPPVASGAELRSAAARVAARVDGGGPSTMVQDASLQREWAALQRRLMTAIDHRRPLDALRDQGLVAHADGSYSIDLGKSPQWWPLDARMEAFLTPGTLGLVTAPLKERGFRDSDIELVRAYLENASGKAAALARNKALAQSFTRRLAVRAASRQGGKLAIARWEVDAFLHQKGLVEDDARRQWAAGLLARLDRQRQRILESYLMEQTGTARIIPDDPDTIARVWKERLARNEVAAALDAEARRGNR